MRANCLCELVLLVSALACGVRSAPLIDVVNANITSRLFEGDIVRFDHLLLNDSEKTLSMIPDDYRQLWENGIVYYTVDKDGYYDQQQIDSIFAGMKMIEDATRVNGKDCIKFQERYWQDNYLYIFNGDGCYSAVGRQVEAGPQELSLKADGCNWPFVAAHEFIHALGFEHEQNRPDRDEYITIMWDNIREEHRPIFEKYTTFIDTMGTPYDYESIMHYGGYAFAIDWSKPTIVSNKAEGKIKDNEKLSKYDIESIQKLYGCI